MLEEILMGSIHNKYVHFGSVLYAIVRYLLGDSLLSRPLKALYFYKHSIVSLSSLSWFWCFRFYGKKVGYMPENRHLRQIYLFHLLEMSYRILYFRHHIIILRWCYQGSTPFISRTISLCRPPLIKVTSRYW